MPVARPGVALDARAEVEAELGALKEKPAKMAKQLKEAVRVRDSAEAGLKTMERQFEKVRKQLHYGTHSFPTRRSSDLFATSVLHPVLSHENLLCDLKNKRCFT